MAANGVVGEYEMPRVFVTVCDNPSKCALNILQFVHVKTGQTPEERIAVIKAPIHQGTGRQDMKHVLQILWT